jgi:hypothetical protein
MASDVSALRMVGVPFLVAQDGVVLTGPAAVVRGDVDIERLVTQGNLDLLGPEADALAFEGPIAVIGGGAGSQPRGGYSEHAIGRAVQGELAKLGPAAVVVDPHRRQVDRNIDPVGAALGMADRSGRRHGRAQCQERHHRACRERTKPRGSLHRRTA